MKKTLAYAATAIILGFAIMLVPLALQTGPPTYQPELPPFSKAPTEGRETKVTDNSGYYGLAAQPSNLLPSSLILLSGLVVALAVYAFIKKRVI